MFSSSSPVCWMTFKSEPRILIPIGVRTPVESMSMRFLIGIVQMFGMPGKRRRASISVWSSSKVMCSGVKNEKSHRAGLGQSEYQRGVVRHSDSGFRTTVVSTIEKGAGSVGEVTRPAFPKTRYLRERAEDAILDLQDPLGLRDRHSRERRRHVQVRSFVEWWHELR